MTDQTRDARFERDLRALLAASEPADVPPSLYAFVDAVSIPAPRVVAPPARGWNRRALALLAAAAALAIVAVGIGSGIVPLPGILPRVGAPTPPPHTQTYRLYYEVTPLDRHEPTTDEVERAFDVLNVRASVYPGSGGGGPVPGQPPTVFSIDVTVPAGDPGRLEELRALLPTTGGVDIGTVSDGAVQVGDSTGDRAFEPAFGNGVMFTPTLRADESALDLGIDPDLSRPFSDWAAAHPGETAVIATSDGTVVALAPIEVPAAGGGWTIPFTPDQVTAGVPRRLLALFSSGTLSTQVHEVAPRGVALGPGITPEPEPTLSPTVAPGQGLRIAYRVGPVLGEPPSAADLTAIVGILSERARSTGAATSVATTSGPNIIAVSVAVPADDASITEPLRQLLGATGLVEFVPVGIGLEGGLIDPEAPRLFGGNPDPVTDARVVYDQAGARMLELTLGPAAAAEFGTWTAGHIGEVLAITVDGEPVATPTIMSAIPGGVVQLSSGGEGGWPEEQASSLATLLASGRLPHPVEEVSTNGVEAAPTPTPTPPPSTLIVSGFVASSCGSIGGCAYSVSVAGPGDVWHADLAGDGTDNLAPDPGLPATLAPGDYTVTATSRFVADEIGNGVLDAGPVDASCTLNLSVAAGDDVVSVSATFAKGSCEVVADGPR